MNPSQHQPPPEMQFAGKNCLRWVIVVAAWLICCGRPSDGLAQTKDIIVANANQQQRHFFAQPDLIDQALYSNFGTKENMITTLRTKAEAQVSILTESISIDDESKKKLKLAAELDIQQLCDEMELVRVKFKDVAQDENKFSEIWTETQAFRNRTSSEFFTDQSFFAKVRTNIIDAAPSEIREAFQKQVQARKEYEKEGILRRTILQMEQNERNPIVFEGEERDKLLEFLKTQDIRCSGNAQLRYYAVMIQLQRVLDSEFEKVLPVEKVKLLRAQIKASKVYERHLKDQGLLDF